MATMARKKEELPRLSHEPSESGEKFQRSRLENLVPEIVLVSDRGTITLRQLEMLRAISSERSQNRAAESLGITAAVLNKQLKELERKAKAKLVRSNARGSELTIEGKQVLRVLETLTSRMSRTSDLVVGCTRITQNTVERISEVLFGKGYEIRILVADDETNYSLASGGLLDIIFVDDPLYAYEFPKENRVHEVTRDFLVHCDRGNEYVRMNSGPQRLGFDTLRESGVEFEVCAVAYSAAEVLDSKYSFFASRLLLDREKVELPADSRGIRIPYTVHAIEITNHRNIREFFDQMAPKQHYPIG
ncbi:MAG TPA: LysR family transcriptional regulator [Euryarchaeota archaeon]|nr:LysR family transcriptional regulator [Euryarchaeota archaeon]